MERVVITGGSGFLGRGLARTLAKTHEVVLLSSGDSEERHRFAQATGCQIATADIADLAALRRALAKARPDLVIHAAALKSVDQVEQRPLEAIDVNVVGSQNLARAAMDTGCRLVVGVSSARAAPPTGDTYGLSKAIVERMFCSLNGKTDTRFVSVRMGNIAWSTGSMLPVWQRMLEDTGVIETTGPEMRRFFLTLDEAGDIVLTAVERFEELAGRVLVRRSKQALVRDVLECFVALEGGNWRTVEGRPGDRADEILVGELELPYCRSQTIDGKAHYILGFNERAEEQLSEEVSTANTEELSRDEILHLVERRPDTVPTEGSAS